MQILINIAVPVAHFSTDLYVSSGMKCQDLQKIVIESLPELTDSFYLPTGQEILCHQEQQSILFPGKSLHESGIRNGHHIILI